MAVARGSVFALILCVFSCALCLPNILSELDTLSEQADASSWREWFTWAPVAFTALVALAGVLASALRSSVFSALLVLVAALGIPLTAVSMAFASVPSTYVLCCCWPDVCLLDASQAYFQTASCSEGSDCSSGRYWEIALFWFGMALLIVSQTTVVATVAYRRESFVRKAAEFKFFVRNAGSGSGRVRNKSKPTAVVPPAADV